MKRILVCLPLLIAPLIAQEPVVQPAKPQRSFDQLAYDYLTNKEAKKEDIELIAQTIKETINLRMKDVEKLAQDVKTAKHDTQVYIDKKTQEMSAMIGSFKSLKDYLVKEYPNIKDELESALK